VGRGSSHLDSERSCAPNGPPGVLRTPANYGAADGHAIFRLGL